MTTPAGQLSLFTHRPAIQCRQLRRARIAMTSTQDIPTVRDAVNFATPIAQQAQKSGGAKQYIRTWNDLAAYVAARVGPGTTMDRLDAGLLEQFATAKTRDNREPGASTVRGRVSAVRALYRYIEPYWSGTCPNIASGIDRRPSHVVVALTDEELEICRHVSGRTIFATTYPAALALAESGASTGEIGAVGLNDLDLRGGFVDLPGDRKSKPRTVPLTPWACRALADRVATSPPHLVTAATEYDSRRTAVTAILRETLDRSGLPASDGYEPRSITAWSGRRAFADTGDLALVARRLGFESLDRAAELIGYDWRTGPTR